MARKKQPLYETEEHRNRQSFAMRRLISMGFSLRPTDTTTVIDAVGTDPLGRTCAVEHKGRDVTYRELGSIFLEERKLVALRGRPVGIFVVTYWNGESCDSMHMIDVREMTTYKSHTMIRKDREGETADRGILIPIFTMQRIECRPARIVEETVKD